MASEHLLLNVLYQKERQTVSIPVEIPASSTWSQLFDMIFSRLGVRYASAAVQGRMVHDASTRISELGLFQGAKVFLIPPIKKLAPRQVKVASGVLTFETNSEEVSDKEILEKISQALKARETNQDLNWKQGLQAMSRLIPTELHVNPDAFTLGAATTTTCDSFEVMLQSLRKIASLLSQAHSTQDMNLEENIQEIIPTCQKYAALLGILGSTLAQFSHVGNTYQSQDSVAFISHTVDILPKIPPAECIFCKDFSSEVLPLNGGKVKLNEHAVFTYYSPEIALAVSLELLIRSIDSGAALIVIRSPQQIEDILQALSSAGYDPQKLIQSKRLVTISNEIYLADIPAVKRVQWTSDISQKALLESGCSSLCMIEECPWFSSTLPSTREQRERYQNQLMDAEKEQIKGALPLVILCLYDKTVFPTHIIMGTEHVHHTVISS